MSFFILKNKTMESASKIAKLSVKDAGFKEDQIRDLIAGQIADFLPDHKLMTIATEFSAWADSSRSLDILALDQNQSLVVIELKRDKDAAHAELQAIRYAAMLSVCTIENVIEIGWQHRKKSDPSITESKFKEELAQFLGVGLSDVELGKVPKIILVSSGFSKEITTTVMWLNENFVSQADDARGFDIYCFEVGLYQVADDFGLYFDQVIPIPAAQDYLVKARKKSMVAEQAAEKRRQRTWVLLQEIGLLKPDVTEVYLKQLPSQKIVIVDETQQRALYLGEGRYRWSFDGNDYASINAVMKALYDLHGVSMGSIQAPAYWARQGSAKTLAEEAGSLFVSA